MTFEQTLSIIKPDAVYRNLTSKINIMIRESGIRFAFQKGIYLSPEVASLFYMAHREQLFFSDLIQFIVSGPMVIIQVLEGEDAVIRYRTLIGLTNPTDATLGTIRSTFAKNIRANSVHGSDSSENARREIAFFISKRIIC